MQDFVKTGLGLAVEIQKACQEAMQNHPLNIWLDYWMDTPLGQYYCDLGVDIALRIHYWPMYLAGQESHMTEWFSQLLSGNLCPPGPKTRPMTQVAETPDTV